MANSTPASNLALAISLACLLSTAPLDAVERTDFTLKNGLDVIVLQVPGGKNVALVTLFDVGEAHDPPGKSGLCHLVEHLYITAPAGKFPRRTAEEFFRRYDGQANAQTGLLYTVVAGMFPGGQLAAEVEEAAARMDALSIEEEDLERERGRMSLELENMYRRLPHLVARNHAREAVCPLEGTARRGGVPEQVAAITLDDLEKWHRAHYGPGNATVIVVGDVDGARARTLMKRHFSGLQRRAAPRASRVGGKAAPPRAKGLKELRVDRPSFLTWPDAIATVAYRAPTPQSALYAPFLLLVSKLSVELSPRQPRAESPVVPFTFAPLDDPEVVYVTTEVREPGPAKDAVASLRERVAEATTIADHERTGLINAAAQTYGLMLGLAKVPPAIAAANPYFAAFSVGRQKQLGIERRNLGAALHRVTVPMLRRAAGEIFGADRGAGVAVRITDPNR